MEERTFELGLNTDNIWTNEPFEQRLGGRKLQAMYGKGEVL